MGNEFRYPNIPNGTEKEQLAYLKRYLYQLVEQLQYATLGAGTASGYAAAQQPQKSVAKSTTEDSQNSVASFNSIKALIIKSADIVNAYYDEISNRLEGLYVAESDFGTYVEETEMVINQSSNDIEQLYTNIQTIITDIESLDFTLADVNAHIKTGLLDYEDGIPIYGIEIGQKNIVSGEEVFNKYARFTSGRLTFYDQNDSEVAYISDYKLHIRNAQITESFRIGGFVETVTSSKDVVTKWVGGNG